MSLFEKKYSKISTEAMLSTAGLEGLIPSEIGCHALKVFYKRGDQILSDNTPIDSLYLLIDGRAKVYKDLANGSRVTYRFYNSGDVIGDVEFFSGEHTSANIEAVSDNLFIKIPYNALYPNIELLSDLLLFLGKNLAEKMKSNSITIAINSFYSLEKRLAMYLSYLQQDESKKAVRIFSYNTLQELSELLGTSYRHLNRVLKKLEENGIVQREKGTLTVVDKKWLDENRDNEWF